MNESKVRLRLKELFPKAQNLSKERLDVYSSKLTAKLTEESTEEDLDALIKDLNDVVNFEQVARQDDQLRTLLSKPKPEAVDTPAPEEPKTETQELKDLILNMATKLEAMQTEKLEDTIQSKFRSHEALKGVPSELLDLVRAPQTLDEVDVLATQIADTYKDKKIQDKLNSFGSDVPIGGVHSSQGNFKPKTLEDLAKEGIKI